MLAERLEFFVPKVTEMMTLWQWLQYILAWALFVTIVGRHELATGPQFLVAYLAKCIQYIFSHYTDFIFNRLFASNIQKDQSY